MSSNTSRSKDAHIGNYGAPGGFYSSLNFLPVNFYVVLKLDHLHCCCANAIDSKNCQSELVISVWGWWYAEFIVVVTLLCKMLQSIALCTGWRSNLAQTDKEILKAHSVF